MNQAYDIYRNSKSRLYETAKECKRLTGKSDKPLIRQTINDEADSITRQIYFYAMKGVISDKQAKMFSNWLHSYAAKLHP